MGKSIIKGQENMVAFANYQNNRGFILDEEKIRKIHEILVKRGQTIDPSCKPMYKIARSDLFAYQTDSVQDFLDEENSRSKRIESLTVTMKHEEEFLLSLLFHDNGTRMTLEGENRDFVFLIASDLKQYLQSEVDICGTSGVQNLLTWRAFYFVAMIIWCGWSIIAIPFQEYQRDKYSLQREQEIARLDADREKRSNEKFLKVQALAKQALAQKDVDKKINFLIQRDVDTLAPDDEPEYPKYDPPESFFTGILSPLVSVMILALIFSLAKIIISRLYDRNVFLTGKEVARYSKLAELRDKIVWGIIIAFVVGVLSSVAMLFLQNEVRFPQNKEAPQLTPKT
jgi:hypothetical protein